MFETVVDSVEKTMFQYLEEILSRSAPEKHEPIRTMFHAHMRHVTKYFIDNYIDKSELTIPFIKWLHKILFPKGYTQTTKMVTGVVVVSMIPGQYKTLENTGVSYLYPGTEVSLVPPVEVKESMERLVSEFNFKLTRVTTLREKKDEILYFMLDFLYIHPFGDANGRVIGILTNLLLIKQNITPVRFDILKKKNLPDFFRAIELSRIEHSLAPFYEVIEKYSEQHAHESPKQP